MRDVDRLLPRPLEARTDHDGPLLPEVCRLALPSDNPALKPPAERLERALASTARRGERHVGPPGEGFRIELRLAGSPAPRPQGYRLSVGRDAIILDGDDEAGLYYGAATLCQWLAIHRDAVAEGGRPLPGLEVRDAPTLLHRGVLLDISRNRVPRMDSLRELIDRLAGWKVNQLQLYTEHTFAYRGHETVWRDASPITAEEARELDRFCAERFIELVPNQNSFGHFHRWLVHQPYRRLAEHPEGVHHAFSEIAEPFSLCPTDPDSLALVEDLWDQLLPQFSSRQANAGLDETFDLGTGRSAAACTERGIGEVYLDYLLGVRRLLLERGRRLQFWADIALSHGEILPRLPGDVIPLVWGYEADHPFAEQSERIAASGLDFYLCPGTSSWNSLAGRTDVALDNVALAAGVAAESGATGLLVTDWGDHGHLQPPAVSRLGLLAGAAFAWNPETARAPRAIDWAETLDLHAFDGAAGLGAAALELGRAADATGIRLENGTVLFRLLLHAGEGLTHERFERLDRGGLERARERIEAALETLAVAEPAGRDLPRRELDWAGRLLAFACRLGAARLAAGREAPLADLPGGARRDLASELASLVDELAPLWLESSRPGGLDDSRAKLVRVLDGLRPPAG